jgi:hypothetical protein
MGILFFIAFVILGYFYLTELIIPWYKRKRFVETVKKVVNIEPNSISQTIKTDLPMGSVMATNTVNINMPVLLVGKQNDLRIYYPDNTVDYFSYIGEWKKIKTGYRSVYEYATRTDSIIMENL